MGGTFEFPGWMNRKLDRIGVVVHTRQRHVPSVVRSVRSINVGNQTDFLSLSGRLVNDTSKDVKIRHESPGWSPDVRTRLFAPLRQHLRVAVRFRFGQMLRRRLDSILGGAMNVNWTLGPTVSSPNTSSSAWADGRDVPRATTREISATRSVVIPRLRKRCGASNVSNALSPPSSRTLRRVRERDRLRPPKKRVQNIAGDIRIRQVKPQTSLVAPNLHVR